MPDVINFLTCDFSLSVWVCDIAKAQNTLEQSLAKRKLSLSNARFRVNPPLELIDASPNIDVLNNAEWGLTHAIFFENKQYEFEFEFVDDVSTAWIEHKLHKISEAFRFKKPFLRGSIDFANDIGWFGLDLVYVRNGKTRRQQLSFEVLPTKLAMAQDLSAIYNDLDQHYPLWRFSFAHKTTQYLAKERLPHPRFDVLWLAHFERLRQDLIAAIKLICRQPQARLLNQAQYCKPEQIRGRISQRQAEKIRQATPEQRLLIEKRGLSLDTPENRFVKQVIKICISRIAQFRELLLHHNKGEQLSEHFYQQLNEWKLPFEQILLRPIFAEIGTFSGLLHESLVLHQRVGYAEVYRIWQELKLYLGELGNDSQVALKNIAELYEVWCFIALRDMLLELGFVECNYQREQLRNDGLELQMIDGMQAAFTFKKQNIVVHLAHEPTFANKSVLDKIYSATTKQRPDIFLQIQFPNGEQVQWIFDAKYRIADDGIHAPDDAINQMHRYRDALLYAQKNTQNFTVRTRPILGAFVLYPAFLEEDQVENPYESAINTVNIGAFPLLPNRQNLWLKTFLQKHLCSKITNYETPEPDQYFIEDAARIAPVGTYLKRYHDLTLVASLGERHGRDKAYLARFEHGKAQWYHIPVSTAQQFEHNVIYELSHCALGVYEPNLKDRYVSYCYQVKSIQRKPRNELTLEQAGKLDPNNESEYWLIELQLARALPKPIKWPKRKGRFLLTNEKELHQAQNANQLSPLYQAISQG